MNALKNARKELGKTQNEAARDIGISYSMYVKMELGDKNPSRETMNKTARYFKKTVDELFFTNFNHSK